MILPSSDSRSEMSSAVARLNHHKVRSVGCEPIQSDMFTPSLLGVFNNPNEFVQFVKTCHGSRCTQDEVIQLKESGNDSYLTLLVRFLIQGGYIEDLVMDKFGNYFIQTLMGSMDRDSLKSCIDSLTENSGSFASMCTHQFGSHVIQTAINLSGGNLASSDALAECLCKNIVPIANNFLGSICLMHAIDSLSPAIVFSDAIAIECRSLILSRHGHLVVIHALERLDNLFVEKVAEHALQVWGSIISDDFGFRVVQQILVQLHVRQLYDSTYITKIIASIKFTARCFPIIEYLVKHFPTNHQVRHKLIPAIVQIVQKGKVRTPQRKI